MPFFWASYTRVDYGQLKQTLILDAFETHIVEKHRLVAKNVLLVNGWNTVSRVLSHRRDLTEFCGKRGEFCEKLGESALAHK